MLLRGSGFHFGPALLLGLLALGASQSSTAGPVAYWPLDAVSGSTTPDASTRSPSNPATLNGGPTLAPGKVGNGMSFDPAGSQFLSVADAPALRFGTASFTVAFWAMPANLTSKVRVVNKWDNAGSGWLIDFNSDAGGGNLGGAIRWRITDPVNPAYNTALVTASGVLTATTAFVHVGAVCDRTANQLRLYLNGSEIAPSPMAIVGSPDLSMPGISVGIGTLVNAPGGYYSGMLDEVQLFDRALSAAEIQALATLTGPPTAATLTATVVGSRQVDLTWTAGTSVSNYQVERSPQGSSTWTSLTPIGLPSGTTRYSDLSVTPESSVDYRVISINPVGTATSNIASVTLPATPPRSSSSDDGHCGCGMAGRTTPGLLLLGSAVSALGLLRRRLRERR